MARGTETKRIAKYKYTATRALAKQKWIELGPNRNLEQLVLILGCIVDYVPDIKTLERWKNKFGWAADVAKYDAEVDQKLYPQYNLPWSPAQVESRAVKIFHAKEKFLNIADQCSQRVLEWVKDPNGKSKHVSCAAEAKTLADVAINMVKMTEVLEGRVSDRQAEETTISPLELAEKATDKVRLAKERLQSISSVQLLFSESEQTAITVDN